MKRRLEQLCDRLEALHWGFLALRVLGDDHAGRILELHWKVRRLVAECAIETLEDIDLVLEAAERARDLDPHFEHQEPGSYCQLTSKALDAIWQRRAGQELAADKLLAAVLRKAKL